jgi:hypothetical protein
LWFKSMRRLQVDGEEENDGSEGADMMSPVAYAVYMYMYVLAESFHNAVHATETLGQCTMVTP